MTPGDMARLTGAVVEDEVWRAEALCAGVDAESFFAVDVRGVRPAGTELSWGGRPQSVSFAKALCTSCPVVADCLDHALRTPETHGIWGGTTPDEREIILLGLAS